MAERREARSDFDRILRELTTNLLRIAAGAGKSDQVLAQIARCIEASQPARPSAGAIERALFLNSGEAALRARAQKGDLERWEKDGTLPRLRAEYRIIRSALRVSASQFAGDGAQETNGRFELEEGILEWRDAFTRRPRAAPRPRY